MKERDKWDEIVRSKLSDFEADTVPGDWEAMIDRLPGARGKVVSFRRWRYAAAAAVAALALLSGGYYLFNQSENQPLTAGLVEKTKTVGVQSNANQVDVTPNSITQQNPEITGPSSGVSVTASVVQPKQKISTIASVTPASGRTPQIVKKEDTESVPSQEIGGGKDDTPRPESNPAGDKPTLSVENQDGRPLIADARPVSTGKKSKRWGIGAGGGSYSIGTAGADPVHFLPSIDNYFGFNTEPIVTTRGEEKAELKKLNVSHKHPISFGLGVGYALNDRWSLQSGLTYTLLKSEWTTISRYQGYTKQKLHYVGIPFGVSYKIAEWQRFRLYAAAGSTVEKNVAGRLKTSYYYDNEFVESEKETFRTKDLQFSVNGRVVVSYPLFRYASAFAEGGADYYFDNKSSVETIRSEKPFNVSLQAGIRFGF
jgi:hypothetical protein